MKDKLLLTPEETFYLHFNTAYEAMSSELIAYQEGVRDGSKAQFNKIFSAKYDNGEPMVALLDENQETPLVYDNPYLGKLIIFSKDDIDKHWKKCLEE